MSWKNLFIILEWNIGIPSILRFGQVIIWISLEKYQIQPLEWDFDFPAMDLILDTPPVSRGTRLPTRCAFPLIGNFNTLSYLMYKRFSRVSIPFLLFSLNNISGDVIGQKKVICLRVEFQESESSGTSGNGQFLMNPDTTCGNYIIDPPPHDKTYFQSQLEAVNNYFHSVSYQKFGIDLDQSNIFPESNNLAYTLPFPMDYYNPYGESESLKEERLITLFKDAISVADSVDLISFEDSDFVIVFHAGIGQDFSLPYLDPTPEDIPSTYVDRDMLGEPFLGVEHGIILPETENHLLFEEGSILFDQASEPCDYQYGLTGVMALMVGFASELPPLWDLESGESRIGIFGLMDQGSNNGRGLIPSPPDAWTRIFAGWENPGIVKLSNPVFLPSRSENNMVKVPITDSEYFLIDVSIILYSIN